MDLLSSMDLTKKQVLEIFDIAKRYERDDALRHKSVALLFEEPSTRTMVSFEVAVSQLDGHAIYIDAHTSQVSRGEELGDTARILSSYCDFIVVRMNDHNALVKMAKSSSVPVINALTQLEHPTQALADSYTIMERKGSLDGLRIAFLGDIAQNTFNSLMVTAARLGAEISLVGPRGWKPNGAYVKEAKRHSKVAVTDSMREGLKGADVIYTDTFVSMGDEAETANRRKIFAPYQLNSKTLSYAKRNAIVMHPLPAHRGEEITAGVLDGRQSAVWQQAKNKLVLERALLIYMSRRK